MASNLAVPLSFEPLRGSIVMTRGTALGAAGSLGAADGAAVGLAGEGFAEAIGMDDANGAGAALELGVAGAVDSTFCGPPQAE